MSKQRVVTLGLLVALLVLATSATVLAAPAAGFGQLYLNGEVVRTVVPPANAPKEGTDNLYVIMEGADGQLPVAAVGPGDPGYRGGKWAFHSVTWNTAPYLVISEADVLAAETAGDLTITRVPENDFKCPIQP